MPAAADSAARKTRRQKALGKGHSAERLAGWALRLKGYRILAMRFLARGGEIDIIAQRGTTIAFVEVKSRASLMNAMMSVDTVKRRRMSLTVRAWLAANPWASRLTLRGDAIYVVPWRWPHHIAAAIPLDLE